MTHIAHIDPKNAIGFFNEITISSKWSINWCYTFWTIRFSASKIIIRRRKLSLLHYILKFKKKHPHIPTLFLQFEKASIKDLTWQTCEFTFTNHKLLRNDFFFNHLNNFNLHIFRMRKTLTSKGSIILVPLVTCPISTSKVSNKLISTMRTLDNS
jgi:hypothetical protein